MDASVYEVEAAVEATHWWFVGRRRLLGRLLADLQVAPTARILDIGTSTGTNLRMLRDLGFTHYQGLDPSPEAVRWCAEKALGDVVLGDACGIPFAAGTFDLVLATDVLEHLENDTLALTEIVRVLKPGAPVIITVPAFAALWGRQDEVSQHLRRYRGRELLGKLAAAGLVCTRAFYFNYLLLIPIFVARQLINLLHIEVRSENEINSPCVNRLLTAIFDLDVRTAPLLRPPAGVSFLAVARRP